MSADSKHLHQKIVCVECDTIIDECECDSKYKNVLYGVCESCSLTCDDCGGKINSFSSYYICLNMECKKQFCGSCKSKKCKFCKSDIQKI
jgi:hypothetical protein